MTTPQTRRPNRVGSTPNETASGGAQTPTADQNTSDAQWVRIDRGSITPRPAKVGAAPDDVPPGGDPSTTVNHRVHDTPVYLVDGGSALTADQTLRDAHGDDVDGEPNSTPGPGLPDIQAERAGRGPNSVTGPSTDGTHRAFASDGPASATGQVELDSHAGHVGRGSSPQRQPKSDANSMPCPSAAGLVSPVAPQGKAGRGREAKVGGAPTAPSLLDPVLSLAADVLDDVEKVRIANENRLRQLTRSVEDSDGEMRGFGLDETNPAVARLAAIVDTLHKVEDDATRNLEKTMRTHPLHPWVKAQRGLGDKQVARLLGAIGDPYIRPELVRKDGTVESSRPRMVSELWAYCGYHVLPAGGQWCGDSHGHVAAGRDQGGDPSHVASGAQYDAVGVAPRRQRGQKSNWSDTARKRAWLVAKSCVRQLDSTCPVDPELGYAVHIEGCGCSPYRVLYDTTKAKYAGAVHSVDCVRCGPAGKPAPAGSPLSKAHIEARALRAMSKELLRDLWREAKRIHEAGAE